tara:strand:- start:130 stop:651 length:522 start_codon:yes stop_codon:yes gene_type:complete
MIKLDNKPLSYDRAFTHNGIQYPANWLRLSSLEERNALGITEVSDAPSYDQRFYWGVDNPKDLDQLKTNWSSQQNDTAGTLLHDSDWRVVKAKETGTNIPTAWKTYRADVRTACNARQTEIAAVTTVEALKELFFGVAQVQQTDSEGKGVVDDDDKPVMIANPNLATAWPTSP